MRRAQGLIWIWAFVFALAGGVRAAPVGDIEIDRIEIIGVSALTTEDVEAALQITAGDVLDSHRVVQTEENLTGLYRLHGYDEVRIKAVLSKERAADKSIETVLRFRVTEGLPTRVARVTLVPEGLNGTENEKFWSRVEPSLESKIGLKVGDVFDQEKVSGGKRILLDSLAAEEFVGARADDIRIRTVPAPQAEAKTPAGRWVDVEFHLDLGDRVSFGFRGNRFLTLSALHALVDEQRLVGLSKDFVSDIRAKIEEAYRNEGFSRVSVKAYTYELPEEHERHVTYEIDEGPRVRLESVDFDGNSNFSSELLRQQFFEHASPLLQNHYYVAHDVERASELLVEWMKARGYLSAKLVTINTSYAPPRRESSAGMRLTIYLYEGDQTVVRRITLDGVRQFTPDEADRLLGAQEGAPFNPFAFEDGLNALRLAYRDRGFLGVRFVNAEGQANGVVRYSQQNRVADVSLEVSEGPQYRVSRIEIEGLTSTKPVVVLREMLLQEGDIAREDKILATETALRKIGIFSNVEIHAVDDPAREGYKVLRVSVAEGTPGIIGGGPGIRNDLGIRVFGQVAYQNVAHLNHTIALNLNANHRFQKIRPASPDFEYQGELNYVWPWFLGVDRLTFLPRIQVEKTQYINFDVSRREIGATLEKPLTSAVNLIGGLTYNLEFVHQFNSSINNFDNQAITIGSITPSLRLDLRDDPLAPTRGFFATTSLEVADPALLSQRDPYPVGYYILQARTDYLLPVAKDVIWLFSFRTGFERSNEKTLNGSDPNDRSGSIPAIKTFTLGGVSSMRGFNDQEINVQDKAIRGLASFVNYRTQLDLPFAGPMRFGPFIDAGNIHVDRYTLGDLRYGVGAGFHYQTPIGPVNFDLGFKIDPKPTEDPWVFHFSVGVI